MENQVLRNIVKQLAQSIRKQDFLTYFKKISYLGEMEGVVVLGVVSAFMRDNLTHKFGKEVLDAVKQFVPSATNIELQVDRNIENPGNALVIDCIKEYKDLSKKTKEEDVVAEEEVGGINARIINDKYRLDNFIVGPSNQLAFAACEAVTRRPGSAYNPLYIYGDVGLGKTHLLQGTGNAIKSRYKDKKIIYTTADRFLSDYVTSVKKRTVDKLKEKYSSIDVLIIDDVQFLANKTQTQEMLYNIFNIMYESGRQIILSGDRSPRELTELEPRLKSRFEWGIIVDIGVPDFETRLAILQEKSRNREFILTQEVAEYIAYNAHSNVRELEGILNQIIAEYELHETPPTLENVSARMNRLGLTNGVTLTKSKRNSTTSYDELVSAVSDHFGVDKKNILGDERQKEYMIPRQVAMYLLKNKMNYTYERIGNIFSGRNHSAVLYSCRKLESILKKDQNLYYEVNVIRDKLGL
ncbi:MAG: chromosomal replication initiator protein DnaA [Candidatus Gracilibacteria bacterium]|nr:chromosomal replication initiator protein DnaA [Candidatus Gracilibacteria bacterium]